MKHLTEMRKTAKAIGLKQILLELAGSSGPMDDPDGGAADTRANAAAPTATTPGRRPGGSSSRGSENQMPYTVIAVTEGDLFLVATSNPPDLERGTAFQLRAGRLVGTGTAPIYSWYSHGHGCWRAWSGTPAEEAAILNGAPPLEEIPVFVRNPYYERPKAPPPAGK